MGGNGASSYGEHSYVHLLDVHPKTHINYYLVCVTKLILYTALEDGSIRLTDGTEGRVETLYNGRWGIICDTFWSTSDGTVACVELGYGDDVVNTEVFTE